MEGATLADGEVAESKGNGTAIVITVLILGTLAAVGSGLTGAVDRKMADPKPAESNTKCVADAPAVLKQFAPDKGWTRMESDKEGVVCFRRAGSGGAEASEPKK